MILPKDKRPLDGEIYIDEGDIIIDFGTPLSWVAATAEEARAFAEALLEFADELDKRKAQKE